MSRGRSARQSSQTDFLQQNPKLIEYETQIDVVKNEKGHHVLEVTRDGGTSEQTEVPETNLNIFAGPIEGPNFELDASYQTRFFGERDASVPLTDLGIGVTSGGDVIKALVSAVKGDLDEGDLIGFASAASKETLKLDIDEIPLETDDFLDHGGTSICVDVDILDGDGQIQLVLVDDEGGETTQYFDTMVEVEVSLGGSRARSEKYTTTELRTVEQIKAIMAEGQTFESVEIGTTGDLEIAVTGIDFTTGYVDGLLPA